MRLASDALTAAARTMGSSMPDVARLRRRALATGGFILFVAAFLFVVGLRDTAVLVLLVTVGVAAVATLGLVVFRARGDLRRYAGGAGRRARRVSARAAQGGAGLARSGAASARRGGQVAKRAQSRVAAGPRSREAVRLNARGVDHRRNGRHDQAAEDHRKALSLMREAGDRRGEAMTENSLALALARAGDDRAALEHFDRSLAILGDLDDDQTEGQVLANVGLVHSRRGRRHEAAHCLSAALRKLSPESPAYQRVEEQLRRAS